MNDNNTITTIKAPLESVNIELEWRSGGIFNKIYPRKRIDLDLGIISLSKNNSVIELITYNNLTSKDGSIKHSGDNINSETNANRESISIDLTKVRSEIDTIMIAVHSFNGIKITETHNATLRMYGNNLNESVIFDLKEFDNSTGIILGYLTRTQNARKWKFVAVGVNAEGQSINQLASTAIMFAPKIS